VYDYAHIGNFRAFLTYDVLKRWLEYTGYIVDHVCNLTDVDDKIIVKMASENKSLKEITEIYTNAFFEDLDVLNIRRAGNYPKATEHIVEIKDMIGKLVHTGYAYAEKGSVYFRVKAFEDYGKLARLKMQEMQDGAGGSGPNDRRGSDDKESNRDFALWKSFNPLDKEVVWDSAFGRGRPGWHIECSAMCYKHLGETIDIHAGGVDLVFPHHENEIAQSEAFTGKPFCNYWVHNGFVNINDEKMSKSLKNFKTLRDIAQSPFDARAFRFMVVTSQYRNPLNFNPETLKSASNSLRRIDKLLANLKKVSESGNDDNAEGEGKESLMRSMMSATTAIKSFEEAMCDDMNTPRASAALFMLVGVGEKAVKNSAMSPAEANLIVNAILRMDAVFGVFYEVPQAYFTPPADGSGLQSSSDVKAALDAGSIPPRVAELAEKRALLKSQKLFAEADEARAEIAALGYEVKDKKTEFEIYKL
jgi:cysteinyl-tRNA synthetase